MTVRPLFLSLGSFGPASSASEESVRTDIAHTPDIKEDLYQVGFDDAKREFEKRIEELRRKADEELECERRRITDELNASMSAACLAAVEEAEMRLGNQIGGALEGLVSETLCRKAIEDLSRHLRPFLLESVADSLTISGPEALVSDLRARLSDFHGVIRAEMDPDAADVTASVGVTSFHTCIDEWRRTIFEMPGDKDRCRAINGSHKR